MDQLVPAFDPENFLRVAAVFVKDAFSGPTKPREAFLAAQLETAKTAARTCFRLAPMLFPKSTPEMVKNFLTTDVVKIQNRVAELAELDSYQAETFVICAQRAIEAVSREF